MRAEIQIPTNFQGLGTQALQFLSLPLGSGRSWLAGRGKQLECGGRRQLRGVAGSCQHLAPHVGPSQREEPMVDIRL